MPRARLDPDFPRVHFDDPLGDRQSEPGPALLFRGRAVRLLELGEDLGLVGLADAGSGVANGDRERAVRGGSLDGDFSRVGELDGVADEIEQDLRDTPLVAIPSAGASTSALNTRCLAVASGSTALTTPCTYLTNSPRASA